MFLIGSILALASLPLFVWWGGRDALDAVTTPDEKPDGEPKYRHYVGGRYIHVWDENE